MSAEFVFIHVQKPKDALKLAKDSHIRSHVTRRQWRDYEERSQLALKAAKKVKQSIDSDEKAPKNALVRQSKQPVTIELPFGGLRGDPFRSYPVEWRPFLPHLVDHYLMSMAVDIPELDQPGNRGLLRTDWFPLVMTEPSLFLVIVLLAASNFASVQAEPTEMKLRLLGLRFEAVQSVNQSLVQHRGVSDAMIGAIAKMASYEAMYGNLDNYAVHMHGLQRAVELRGGLDSLGLGGLLRRIVIWIDRNGAFLNGSPLYFPGESFAPNQPLPDPNPGHFLGAQ